jgi:hypothetical protein
MFDRMSTERHLSRKRPNITIDAEAQNETVVETAVEPVVEETAVEAPAFGRPDNETAAPVETTSEKPTPRPSTASASTASALTGGIIGAVLALAGAYGLQTSGVLPDQNQAASAVSDRLSALEATIASGTSSEGEQVAALSAEVTALKDSVAALSQAAGNSSVADRVTALEQTASLATPATNGADLTALASRLATLESKTSDGSLNEALTTTKNALATEINSLKSEVAALQTQMTERASEPGLAATVAATALRAAVDRGGAFGAELENLAAVQPDAPAIAALRSFAASGVPTRQDLTAEFETAAQVMMAASEPVDPNATMFTKLMDSAKGLVKVRPVGSLEGDTAAARIARMGEALAKGDDTSLATEFAALPASSRDAGAAFMARFNARAEADRLIAEAVRAASPKAGG